MAELVFIGVPYWLGKKDDYSGSVDIVKNAGVASQFDAAWVDIAPDFDAYNHPVNAVNSAVAEAIKTAVANNRVPLIIADDCTVCLGNMKGLEDSDPDVLWYDAHGDFNTEETSPSGFLGGMPLAAMVGMGNQNLVTGIDFTPIASSKVYLTDGRDLDEAEAQLVADSDVTHWENVSQIQSHAWDKRPLYVHFDGDVLRLEDHPAVSYPADGGVSVDNVLSSVQYALTHANVKAVHFTCWNARLEGAPQSQETILHCIRTVAQGLRG
ncbi:MAG: arginase family protein [Chloroflexota bacterium]